MEDKKFIKIPTFAELAVLNQQADYLFWVGSAGSYDDRAKKITRAFAKLLVHCNINFAVLGTEESDSGDVARRAGNEFLFQMQAMQNIETMKMYQVKKIITCDPHDYNTLKNEYPELGGRYEVQHHSEFIYYLMQTKKIKIETNILSKKVITFHDPCYLGRGNSIFMEPRYILQTITSRMTEMKRFKQRSLCCGAGGAQMFKEAEKGQLEIYNLRTKDAIEVNPEIIATACPFCMTMLTDGIKLQEKQREIAVMDIVELLVQALGI